MNIETPLVVVVIANWNLRKDLLECLSSLYETDYPRMHIIVVDNNSSDDSVASVEQQFPQTQLIKRTENGGYAVALNDGIRAGAVLNPEFYLILNNDTLVPPDTLGRLVDVMLSDPQIAIAAPKIIYHYHPRGYSAWVITSTPGCRCRCALAEKLMTDRHIRKHRNLTTFLGVLC